MAKLTFQASNPIHLYYQPFEGKRILNGFIIESDVLGREEILEALGNLGIYFDLEKDVLEDDPKFMMNIGPHFEGHIKEDPANFKKYLAACRDTLEIWKKLEKLPPMLFNITFIYG